MNPIHPILYKMINKLAISFYFKVTKSVRLGWNIFYIYFFYRKSRSSFKENQDWKSIDIDWWNWQNGAGLARWSNSCPAWNAWSWAKWHFSRSLFGRSYWFVKSSISLHRKYLGHHSWTSERPYGDHWYFWIRRWGKIGHSPAISASSSKDTTIT